MAAFFALYLKVHNCFSMVLVKINKTFLLSFNIHLGTIWKFRLIYPPRRIEGWKLFGQIGAWISSENWRCTSQKMKFFSVSMTNIRSSQRIWLHLPRKSLMKDSILVQWWYLTCNCFLRLFRWSIEQRRSQDPREHPRWWALQQQPVAFNSPS